MPGFTITLISLTILLALWVGRHFLFEILTLISNREALTVYLQSLGWWGPFLLVVILSSQVIFAVIPGHILMITGGYLYGFSGGLTLNLLGTVVASQAAFVAVRWAGQPLVSRLASASVLERWHQLANKQGLAFFLFFFWFPVVPSNIMNFVAGLSSISFWSFLTANLLGRLPGVMLVTLIGAYGFELSTRVWVILAIVGMGLFFGGRYSVGKLQQRYFVGAPTENC